MKNRRTAAAAVIAVVAVLAVGWAGAESLTVAEPGTCDVPVEADSGSYVEWTFTCAVDKPPTPATPPTPPTPATPATPPTATATATATVTATQTTTATVTATPSPSPTPTVSATPTATAPPAPKKIIGMSAASNLWDQRVSEVGACGLEARRIFAQYSANGLSTETTIRQAVADGMLPVVSYKLPSGWTTTAINNGTYDAGMQAAATFLNSLGVTVAVTIWHEPNGDMTGPQYVTMQERLLPFFAAKPNLRVGPIFNGFLTDTASGKTTLQTFTSPTLWNLWDFYGYDTYDGPNGNPADRIDPQIAFAAANGKPNIPQLIGEYNGIDAAAIKEVGDKVLAAPTFWVAMLWNTDADPAIGATHLSGDRLAAYQATKADARALHEPAC